jgi:hypothetical protein
MRERHGTAPGWNDCWSDPYVSVDLFNFLEKFVRQLKAVPVIKE